MFYAKRTDETPEKPVFLAIHEDKPGGITIASDDLPTTLKTLGAGTTVGKDGVTAGLFRVVKTAEVYETVNGTSVKVKKNHVFIVGDFIADDEVSTAITAIDTTNALYDLLTVTTAMNATVGDVLVRGLSEVANVQVESTAVVEDIASDTLTAHCPTGINGITATISQNSSDALSVSAAGGKLVIKLADTTATKNTAALIQAAVQAKGEVGGVNWEHWTFTAGGNWDTAATGGTLTTPTDSTSGGTEFLTSGFMPKYTPYGLTKFTIDTEDAETDGKNLFVGCVRRGTAKESLLPYPLDSGGYIKKNLPHFIFE